MVIGFRRYLLAVVLAPLPLFALLCFVLVRPEFGMDDVLIGARFAFAISYGLMLIGGLPADWLLRRSGNTGLAAYMVVAVVVTWVAVTLAYALDDAAYARAILLTGFGLLMFIFSALIAAATAALFWRIAVAPIHAVREPY